MGRYCDSSHFAFGTDPEADLQGITGLDRAIADNDLISILRKEFLLEQLSKLTLRPAAPPQLWERDLHDFLQRQEQAGQ